MNKIQKFLAEAKSKLTAKTWVNHSPDTYKGEHCCATALNAVKTNNFWGEARDFFQQAIKTEAIIVWNDAKGRTLRQVHAAFDKAIKLARNK